MVCNNCAAGAHDICVGCSCECTNPTYTALAVQLRNDVRNHFVSRALRTIDRMEALYDSVNVTVQALSNSEVVKALTAGLREAKVAIQEAPTNLLLEDHLGGSATPSSVEYRELLEELYKLCVHKGGILTHNHDRRIRKALGLLL